MSEDTTKATVDFTEDRIFPVGWGLVYRIVCAPRSWSADRVAEDVTRNDPPGTSLNQWVISEPHERKDDFNNVNHLPCPDCDGRIHWLLNC